MAFEGESVISNSSSVTTCFPTHNQNHTQSPNPNGGAPKFSSPQKKNRVQGDTCFSCQKKGHWAKDCPSRTPKKPEPSSPKLYVAADGFQYSPCLLCPCGAGTCLLLTSNTDKNPGRKFYTCPNKEAKCKFFKWSDMVRSDEIIYAPICGCGAAPCRIHIETSGPNAGRKLFVCPIKKGQGACNFFQWQDVHSPSNNLVEQGDFTHPGLKIQAATVDASRNPQHHRENSGSSKRDKAMMVEFKGLEDTSDDLLRTHCKRLRHGSPKIGGSVFEFDDLSMTKSKAIDLLTEEEFRASVLSSKEEIRHRQAEYRRQISIAGATPLEASTSYSSSLLTTSVRQNCLVTAEIHRSLGLHFRGWWGRLAFPPSQCLAIPAPKPFFCCVFPSFDPISDSKSVDLFEIEASPRQRESPLAAEGNNSSPVLIGQDDQSLSVVPWEPSKFEGSLDIVPGRIMEVSVSEAFGKVALILQDKLVTLLESMHYSAHEFMVREAKTTFAALGLLFIDCRPFCKRVEEFISHASSLAEIGSCIRHDHLSRELLDRCNLEKKRLHDISGDHAKAKADLETCRERLQVLRTEASRVRGLLCQLEMELADCEAQNKDFEICFDHISKEMEESERSVVVASKEAEAALKLCQQREVEHDAAKAAFDRARALLRES
ncbi:unnamed protein product [Ilex paraguariensis]|uniref:CCHC-type domain-containing protein n=1 Tax=Ilex paraguariensis TaxID=185542 RepID=A0ABC8TDH0_9AQUA